ncbi:putative transporter [Prevotella dentasini]|uniref:putative transporter n=1 Tax=Prevotella dentasini TaxID=589537 RepID=UPI000AA92E35|nr:putative transporter [Prevotella dentasini]
MNWINGLFNIPSALQAVVILSLICAIGLTLGKIRLGGISLGIASSSSSALRGQLRVADRPPDAHLLRDVRLVLFVYTLGLHVGPNFFGSFRQEGTMFNLWSLGVILVGTAMAVALTYIMGIPMSAMVGILCGATTNTPALGAAEQALAHVGNSGGEAALATAVTYPLGVVGVIFAMIFIRKFFVRPADLELRHDAEEDYTYIGQFVVVNPALVGKTVAEIVQGTHLKFIISRIWRNKEVLVPKGETVLKENDNLLVITNKDEAAGMEILFGKQVTRDWNKEQIDWNHIDSHLESRIIVLSKPGLNGKRLGQLHLRDMYGVNVSRVLRGDIKLLATERLVLRYGDRLTIIGKPGAIDHAEHYLGNSVKTLNEPNISSIFLGMMLGLALGTIPLSLPGMDAPIRLGIAGGPIMMGIIVGAFGPRLHIVSYTTRSASLMLRKLGLALYLACLGLDAGKDFLSTVIRPEGLLWVGAGFLLTVVPIVIVGIVALRTRKFDFGTVCGILCGSMANPMALGYANDTLKGETGNISYAAVYPLGMFIRVIIAQVLVMFFV